MLRSTRIQALLLIILVAPMATRAARAEDQSSQRLTQQFDSSIRPFLKNYCLDCHSGDEPEAKLDLANYQTVNDVTSAAQTWEIALERLEAGDMPPAESAQPETSQRRTTIQWIREVRRLEAERNAGDPGPVLVRRLSNAEYNYTIRDLTGVDIRPTKTFPVDPANAAGFDNSGESLTMSPALLNKYLAAARLVVEYMVLTPSGLEFAPHPVVTETDRDKYCVKRIVQFYQRQPTDYADYFFTAWQYRQQSRNPHADRPMAEFARRAGLSAPYLERIWTVLNEPADSTGPLGTLRRMWSELPKAASEVGAARQGCEQMRDFIVRIRPQLQPSFDDLVVEGSHKGSQTFVLWKNHQYAAARRSFDHSSLIPAADAEVNQSHPRELVIPADESQRRIHEADVNLFCSTFPDAFFISERGRDYLGKPRTEQEKGRLLSAGFHSMMGYYRDDRPLYELILDEHGRHELDRLWQELDFVTSAPHRQYAGFLWFERTDSRYMRDPEFDFARAEDRNASSEPMIKRLAEVYLAKARRNGGSDVALKAIVDYFELINQQIRQVEAARVTARPIHLDAAIRFAERAYRRPLIETEREKLRSFYRALQDEDGLTHEEAIQDTLVSILMSPHFCYRLDLGAIPDDAPGSSKVSTVALTDFELANRLSYFLWSTMPDDELLELARAGRLRQTDVLKQQAARMLRDPRVRGLAVEFGGNWLDFRRFEEHNSVDRNRFPQFTDELRRAMFEEPVRFFMDVAQQDRSILEFLHANHTFVNETLAEHYGINDLSFSTSAWQRVPDAQRFGRGGLLSMAVFLTQNSPGLRTSPVKRGYWVVRRLLGERIPAPPPNVPDLPTDESQLGELTLREVLARHREHKSCAGCHERIDSLGLVFEGFGPVGERRTLDLGDRPVDTSAMFPDGNTRQGLAGLREYLRSQRDQDFAENLSRKLLSYGLSRSLQLSDDLLLEQMRERLAANNNRFGSLIEAIVTSPQFRNRRATAQTLSSSD